MTTNSDFEYSALDDESHKALQHLISINIDSYKGWQHAADHVKDAQLKVFFEEMSSSRQHNAAELQSLVGNSGDDPVDHGSLSGSLHRWWIDAKQSLNGNDVKSVLNEAERGEDAIKHEYEQQLFELGSSSTSELIRRQYDTVKNGHDRVRALRDRYKNPA